MFTNIQNNFSLALSTLVVSIAAACRPVKCGRGAKRVCPISLLQSSLVTELEESQSKNYYAAHVFRQGLDKEDWKLVVTGDARW